MSCGVVAMPLRKPAGKRRSTDSGVEPDRGALSQEKKDQRIALFLSDFDQQGRAGGGGEGLGAAPRPGRAPAPAGAEAAPGAARVGALGLPGRTPMPATALAATLAVPVAPARLRFPARRGRNSDSRRAEPAGRGGRRVEGEPLALSRQGGARGAAGPARPGGERAPAGPRPPPPHLPLGGSCEAALGAAGPHRLDPQPEEWLAAASRRSGCPVRLPMVKRNLNFLF